MGELFAAILMGIIEFLGDLIFEVLVESAMGLLVGVAARGVRRLRVRLRHIHPLLTASGFVFLGFGIGYLTTCLLPHPLVHPFRVRGLSLILSPLITGWVMWGVGRGVRKRGHASAQIESFGYGFVFAFGIALARFLLVG